MADEIIEFYQAPTRCRYKDGDKIFVKTRFKNMKDKIILKKTAKCSKCISFNSSDSHNTWNKFCIRRKDKSDAVHKKPLLRYKYLRICNNTKSQPILSTDLHKRNILKNYLWNSENLSCKSLWRVYDHARNVPILSSRSKSCHQTEINLSKKPVTLINSILDCTNSATLYKTDHYSNFFCQIYRCQLFKNDEESCCCSCNSDAMFEVMKSLYDCYKKKNCDNCNCILCGHLPREERRRGELRKSGVDIAIGEKEKLSKKLKLKSKASLAYEGKGSAEKVTKFKEMAMAGTPLPEGKTASEKDLIIKVRKELGLPQAPLTSSDHEIMNEAYKGGLIIPLEGKSYAQKENILKNLAEFGVPLPEGRSSSEKALIKKINANIPYKQATVPSKKLRKAKAARLLTPLEGKSKEQKERILKGLTKQGVPFPEAKTASDQKLMDQVRAEVGLPPEPKTPTAKEKYNRAIAAGLITPLEGKSKATKDKILRDQAQMGLTLPEGRTPSEKSLIARIKETSWPLKEVRVPSEKLQKAKVAGILTPLEGKTKQQKEKILKGLAMHSVPLPEAKTASDQKLIDKVRAELGLPPEPKSPSAKENYNRAMVAGLITPLEGKSNAKKKKILQEQVKMGLTLPEGRSPSEKALIANIKESSKPEKGLRVPSEKLRKAKEAGFLTPFEGKSKAQKEKILKGLAMHSVPLPEVKTASDQKLIDKVRAELGLPPEPKSPSAKENYNRAMVAGLITPLEGKSNAKKKKILQEQVKMGLVLPEGRSPSEKALISNIKETTQQELESRASSEKLGKIKEAGLSTPIEGKTKKQKIKIIKDLAKRGLPLPEAKTASDQKLMDAVRIEIGLPPEPKTVSARENYDRAMIAGLITPLEGKSISKKEKILRQQAKLGLQLPEGRSPSEKALIANIKESSKPERVIRVPSEKLRKAKEAGFLTPFEGKSKAQKEKILKGLVNLGIPLPEASNASNQKLMDQIRAEVGLPPVPSTPSAKAKYDKAIAAGLITPLEGKSNAKKEKILRNQAKLGLPLPKGRSPSEKSLIARIEETRPENKVRVPSEKLRKAKATGLLTPLEGKTKEQKEKILKGLAMHSVPLPEAKTVSDQRLIDNVRAELGLPPEPKSLSAKENYNRAMVAGLITPLEGKSYAKKKKILQEQAKMGLLLPEGRNPSERALIAKIKDSTRPGNVIQVPSEKWRRANDQGLLTPFEGKSKEQKENILKGLAKQGIPLPEARNASDQKLINKIRTEVGLPPEPKTPSAKEKYNRAIAAGLITPLDGKTIEKKEKILREQAKLGLPLPEGRSPSEKSLIAKIKTTSQPETKLRGLFTPLEGKSRDQKEQILKGLAKQGIPLPVASNLSDQKLIDQIRAEIGLPPEPTSTSAKVKYNQAMAAGFITPLEGKSSVRKEEILRGQAKLGVLLPAGRSSSEKALINKVLATVPHETASPLQKPFQITRRPALPPEKLKKLDELTAKKIKESQGPSSECICDLLTPDSTKTGNITPKIPSEKLRKTKAAGLLEGKSHEQKENILKSLAKQGKPLPEASTTSEIKLMEHIRAEIGLPPEPKTPSAKEKYNKAIAAGLITPLEGKSIAKKEKILQEQAKLGLPLPEGRSPSEKSLIARIKETTWPQQEVRVPSEKLRKAKAAGLLTPLKGKSNKQKEKILKGLVKHGIPFPEASSDSDQRLMDRMRAEMGLPPEPKTRSAKEKYNKAIDAGLITPLEGKSIAKKEKILQEQAKLGLPLPEGRSPSEKSLIARIKETTWPQKEVRVPSEKLRKAKAAGLLTPLEGKSKKQKKNILKGLAKHGIPLPDLKSASDQKLVDQIRADVGLPPVPKNLSAKEKYDRAIADGLITPLEGKSIATKANILRDLAKMGLPLPEGRTPSEKSLIARIKETTRPQKEVRVPSEKLRKARAAGLLTPLEGKSKERKKSILKGLAKHGIPLPDLKSASDQKLVDQVRADVGLPPAPKTLSAKEKYDRAIADGFITPLGGKSTATKENILQGLAKMGLPLPEGRSPSEKSLIAKIKETTWPQKEVRIPSEKLRKAKAAGLLTPLEGKSKEQKKNILKGLVKHGIPLPDAKSASDQKLMDKVRAEVGLPPVPKTLPAKEKYDRAIADGLITPLEGKSTATKENIVRDLAKMGLPLPEGRSPSEKSLIARIKETTNPQKGVRVPSEKLRKAKAAGLLTPLEGKSKEQKKNILKGLAKHGIPLPDLKSASDQKLVDQVRADVGLPPVPKTQSAKEKYDRAIADGLITPLEGKSTATKENILRDLAKMSLPLPEGRSPSEKSLIARIKETTWPQKEVRVPSEKLRKAKAAGLLTPLEGKSKEQKKNILKGLAKHGIPLPDLKSASDQKLVDQVRADVGLPPVPKTLSAREKYDRAIADGFITPLEGKSTATKENILRDLAKMGLPLPEGRSPSEKSLIARIKETTWPQKEVRVPSEKLRKAKAAGLLTPLEGKSKEQKKNILKGLAKHGIPLPDLKSASDQKLVDQVRADVGLPPVPKTQSAKEKYDRAIADGLITPLEGKSTATKENILRDLAKMGLPLPEGRSPSEKSLIARTKETIRPQKEVRVPSEKLRKAKAAGLLTPLEGKSKEQKKNILKGLAKHGIPLPEAKSASDQKLMDKVRAEVGLPPAPKTLSAKEKYDRAIADGLITPLEGKSTATKANILQGLAKMGLPLPEGRSPSEKSLIARIKETTWPQKEVRVPSEKLRKAKAAGLLTPLEGKSKEQKKNILKGLAKHGIPLPDLKSASDQKLVDQVRADVGLPPVPKTLSAREKYDRAIADGFITPLEGKSTATKENILRDLAKMGLPLPEGRSPSEKSLIARIKETTWPQKEVRVPSEKLRKAKAAGLLTPLEGKSKEQKKNILKGLAKHGIPLPDLKSASDQKLVDQVRADVGLPPVPKTQSAKEKYDRAIADGLITPLEGKSTATKENILRDLAKMGLPLPEGRSPSEKSLIARTKETIRPQKEVRVPSEKLRKAKAAGLLTPLEGKSKEQKKNILKGLAKHGIPLPEAKSASDQKLMDKVRAEVGLPPAPKTLSAKEKYDRAIADGLITPLEGKSTATKANILQGLAKMGLPLPEGRSPSEKSLIAKIKETTWPQKEVHIPSEKLRKAKAAGFLTPLEGKSKKQKENILKGLAKHGIPLPDAKSASDQKLMDKVRAEVGLPPVPKTLPAKEKYDRAIADGLITPLEGKSTATKANILQGLAKMGLALPEGRSPSEKYLIAKIKETTWPQKEVHIPSEKLRKAKTAGLLTPLEGKSKEQKENILKGLAKHGIPLPDAKSASDQKLMDKVRAEVGLPPVPKTLPAKEKYDRAIADGLITPLEGKSTATKENILRDLAEMGLPLPEGRSPSEKSLIAKIKETTWPQKEVRVPSEKLRKARAAGLLTPLEGKSKEQKKNILKGLAKHGIPLPGAKSASDQKLIDKIREEVGLPPEPKTLSAKEKYDKAIADGLITPLEGKSTATKENILRDLAKMGLPLPEGRSPSEKSLIAKIKETTWPQKEVRVPSEKLRKAKAAGLLTPLEGKSKEQKKNIFKGLAKHGIPLPDAKSASDQKLMDKVRAEVGLPPVPKSLPAKAKYDRAIADGLITPLEGKSTATKENILRDLAKMGLPLPEGRSPSEKSLIAKIKETTWPQKEVRIPSEKLRKAKAAGLLTPLEGKSKEQKKNILKGLAKHGIPLPEAKSSSDQKLMDKVREEVGLPPEPKTASAKENYDKAMAAGLITPLEGKSTARKEGILRGQAKLGLILPAGRTISEKALIEKVKASQPIAKISAFKPVNVAKQPALSPDKLKKLDTKTAKLMKEKKGPSNECICDLLTPESQQHPLGISAVKLPAKKKFPPSKHLSEQLQKAKEGVFTPLEGKKPGEKKKILKALAMKGIPLPEAKTASEKDLIDEVHTDIGLPPKPSTSQQKVLYDKAMASGLITPLEGKSAAKKEEILYAQAKMGLSLPEGRTVSEKALIGKILKRLAESRLPIPEGITTSEKDLVEKRRTITGLSPEPSDKKSVVKKRLKKTASALSKVAKGVGVYKPKGGILEGFEDIIKTTTCDKGCGCDKKKIKFKHSYVKIRVTSPDISSLCPCPEECLPGVKGGVFVDNEGINVTIGRVLGVPSFPSRELKRRKRKVINYCSSEHAFTSISTSKQLNNIILGINDPSPLESDSDIQFPKDDTIIFIKSFTSYHENPQLLGKEKTDKFYTSQASISPSLESVYLLNTESSISLTTASDAYSVISFSITGTSCYSNYNMQKNVLKWNETSSTTFYSTSDSALGNRDVCSKTNYCSAKISSSNISVKTSDREILLLKAIQSETRPYKLRNPRVRRSLSDDIIDMVGQVSSRSAFNDSSSLFIIMYPSSDQFDVNSNYSSHNPESIMCIQVSSSHSIQNNTTYSFLSTKSENMVGGVKLIAKAKHSTDMTLMEFSNNDRHANEILRVSDAKNYLRRQKAQQIISTDTTVDRPYCCLPKEVNELQESSNIKEQRVKQRNIVSEMVSPMILQEAIAQGVRDETYTIMRDKNYVQHSHVSINRNYQTPVRMCKIPLCGGYIDSQLTENLVPTDNNSCIKFKQSCNPGKSKDLPRRTKKQMSVTFGNCSNDDLQGKKRRSTWECPKCEVNKNHFEVKRNPCSFVLEDGDTSERKSNTKKEKTRSQNGKEKNIKIICKCPQDPLPKFQFNLEDWIDESQIRKMKSELTQTVSGFKLNKLRKISEPEMSFEEILKFYAEKSEQKYKGLKYDTKTLKDKNNDSADCECPVSVFSEEPFQGIKFHIGGKGSRSKGLSGILCFPLDTTRTLF